MGAGPALPPLVSLGIAAVQEVRHDEAQDGVPQELEGLIVAGTPGEVFIGEAGVGEGLVQEAEVGEAMAQAALQLAQPHLPLRSQHPRPLALRLP